MRGWTDIRNESKTSDDRHTVVMLGRVGGEVMKTAT